MRPFLNALHCRCLMLYWLHPYRECWGLNNMCLSNYTCTSYAQPWWHWPAPSEILLSCFFTKRGFSWRFRFMRYKQYSTPITANIHWTCEGVQIKTRKFSTEERSVHFFSVHNKLIQELYNKQISNEIFIKIVMLNSCSAICFRVPWFSFKTLGLNSSVYTSTLWPTKGRPMMQSYLLFDLLQLVALFPDVMKKLQCFIVLLWHLHTSLFQAALQTLKPGHGSIQSLDSLLGITSWKTIID